MEAPAFLSQLRARLDGEARAILDADAASRDAIATGLAEVADRYPTRSIDDGFIEHVAAQVGARDDLTSALPRLRIADLFLAWWSGSGDPEGIAAFEAAFDGELSTLERRFHRLPTDEARQELRIKLFVAGASPPRVREYSGFGFLQNWLRVTAVRSFVDLARKQKRHAREIEGVDDGWLGIVDAAPDPRLAHIKDEISGGAKRAFAAAVAALAPRHRNFLRHAHVDGLTLSQIAALYSVHRATVARTLARARQQLLDDTRSHLAAELGVAGADLESVIRALDTQLELSMSRVLASASVALGTPEGAP